MNTLMIIKPRSGRVILSITDYDLTKAVRKSLEKSFLVREHNKQSRKLITIKHY